MAAKEKQQPAPTAPADAQRIADLSELLGHVNHSWDEQRRALSRQLHDSMGSSLTALTMHLSLLTHHMPPERALTERAAQMKQLLMNIIESNRDMQTRLWNDKLEFLGVTVALSEVAAQFQEQQQITVVCSLPEDELQCPRTLGVVLLRTLEEGLRNVLAHARASQVDVIVDDNDEAIMLTVKDNGVGLAPGQADSHDKHGLRALRERAAYLGGTLTLENHPEQGAALTLILPRLNA